MKDYQRFLLYIDRYMDKYKDKMWVVAYSILPNHFHFVLYTKEKWLWISRFVGNLCAAYTRYYKAKYEIDKGVVYFEGRFKSKYIDSEEYLRQCIQYVEYNPVKHWIVLDNTMWAFCSKTFSGDQVDPGAILEDLNWEFDFK